MCRFMHVEEVVNLHLAGLQGPGPGTALVHDIRTSKNPQWLTDFTEPVRGDSVLPVLRAESLVAGEACRGEYERGATCAAAEDAMMRVGVGNAQSKGRRSDCDFAVVRRSLWRGGGRCRRAGVQVQWGRWG